MVYALECQSDTYGIWLKLNLKPGLCKTKGRGVIEGNNKYMEILKKVPIWEKKIHGYVRMEHVNLLPVQFLVLEYDYSM